MNSRILNRGACVALALASSLAIHPASAQGTPMTALGDRQSPVDILDSLVVVDPKASRFEDIRGLNEKVDFELKNTTGSKWCKEGVACKGVVDQRWGSLKAYPDTDVHIRFGGQSYKLKEFHFHAPAEHLVNGRLSEMEVHFVFAKDDALACSPGEFLVVGQRIVKGRENPELEKIFGPNVKLPTSYASAPEPVKGFVIGRVISGLTSSYRYSGSLTAPAELGCNDPPGNPDQQLASGYMPEVVSWVLLTRTIEMSKEQIVRFQKLFPNGDARAPQSLHQTVTRTPQLK